MKKACLDCAVLWVGSCEKFWKVMRLKVPQDRTHDVPREVHATYKDFCWHPRGTILVVEEKPE